jgi:hypothetical protein
VYFTVTVNDRIAANGVWSYPNPIPEAEPLRDYLAFYPSRMDACYVDDELVSTQGSEYYGGWVINGIVGPFKKRPGEK